MAGVRDQEHQRKKKAKIKAKELKLKPKKAPGRKAKVDMLNST